MTKLCVAKMINSRYNDDVKTSDKRLLKFLREQGWITLDNKLNDKFGIFIRDNNL